MSLFTISADRTPDAVVSIESRIAVVVGENRAHHEMLACAQLTSVERVRYLSRIRCNEQTIARLTHLLQLAQEA